MKKQTSILVTFIIFRGILTSCNTPSNNADTGSKILINAIKITETGSKVVIDTIKVNEYLFSDICFKVEAMPVGHASQSIYLIPVQKL